MMLELQFAVLVYLLCFEIAMHGARRFVEVYGGTPHPGGILIAALFVPLVGLFWLALAITRLVRRRW